MATLSFIAGIAGPTISPDERSFLREADPWGLIVFARNIDTPRQLERLVWSFRELNGREDAPVLIDQEGGRVRRLRPPHWRDMPPAGAIRELHRDDPAAARRAAWLSGRLIGEDLHALGINVDCFPVADLLIDGAHDIVGDRAYGDRPEIVAGLAGEAAEGLRAAGVAAIVKHIPGHGRALADSHLELPRVSASAEELAETDFAAFRGLAGLPMAMTAHVVYEALDPDSPATTSKHLVDAVIRGDIGFDGLLMSDDLSMKALSGAMRARTRAAFAAGCDIALHCNGEMDEMVAVAEESGELGGKALQRAEAALAWPRRVSDNAEALRREFGQLLGLDSAPAVG